MFGHGRIHEFQVAGNILDEDGALQGVLYFLDPAHHVLQGFLRIGQRKQIVQVPAADSAP